MRLFNLAFSTEEEGKVGPSGDLYVLFMMEYCGRPFLAATAWRRDMKTPTEQS